MLFSQEVIPPSLKSSQNEQKLLLFQGENKRSRVIWIIILQHAADLSQQDSGFIPLPHGVSQQMNPCDRQWPDCKTHTAAAIAWN